MSDQLTSLVNKKVFTCGDLEIPSPEQATSKVSATFNTHPAGLLCAKKLQMSWSCTLTRQMPDAYFKWLPNSTCSK